MICSLSMMKGQVQQEVERRLLGLHSHIKCPLCQHVLLTPVEAPCHHIACARCFSSQRECPVCRDALDPTRLRPNEPLSKRVAAVLQTINAYEHLSGRKVTTSPEKVDGMDSEDCFFKNDKKYQKKYEKKQTTSMNDKLLSVSQNDSPMVFPGEAVNVTQSSVDSEIDKNPNSIDKVEEWLSISQIKVGPIVRGPVKNIYPERMHKDFFQRNSNSTVLQKEKCNENIFQSTKNTAKQSKLLPVKIKDPSTTTITKRDIVNDKLKHKDNVILPTRSSKRLSNSSHSIAKHTAASLKSSDSFYSVNDVSPGKRSKTSSPVKSTCDLEISNPIYPHSSKRALQISLRNSSKITPEKTIDPVKMNVRESKKKEIGKDHVVKTSKSKITLSTDLNISKSCSFDANDSELRTIFSKFVQKDKVKCKLKEALSVLGDEPPQNPKPVFNTSKEKNPWKNVKKMRKVLNKPNRPQLNKLDVCVDKGCVDTVSDTLRKKGNNTVSETLRKKGNNTVSETLRKKGNNTVSETLRKKGNNTVSETLRRTGNESESPIHIDDILTHLTKAKCESPEAVRKCSSVCSGTSDVSVNMHYRERAEKPRSKDYLACQAAIIESKKQKFCNEQYLGILSNKPVNESSISEPPLTHLSPIPTDSSKKLKNVVKKLEAELAVSDILKDFECAEDESEYTTDSSVKEINDKGELNLFRNANVDLSMCEKINQSSICEPFPGNTNNKETTLIPFVYKGRLNSHNSSSEERRVPFYHKSKCSPKDWYQIPQDGLNIKLCRDNILTTISIRHQPLADVTTNTSFSQITQTRDAQTSPIPFTVADSNDLHNHLPKSEKFHGLDDKIVNVSKMLTSTQTGNVHCKEDNELSDVANLEASSPPLIISEPVPEPLVTMSKKRKIPFSFISSKRTKEAESGEFPIRDDITVVFSSETQMSEERNTQSKLNPDDPIESLDYNAIMGNAFANIDHDLALARREDIEKDPTINASPRNIVTPSIEHNDKNPVKQVSDHSEKNSDPCNFVPSQRKIIEDETDLRIVSMEVETDVPLSDIIPMTIVPEKKTNTFIHNALVGNNQIRVPSQEQNSQVCNIQSSNNEENSQAKYSENMFSTMFDKNTIGFSQESCTDKPEVQIMSLLPQSISELRKENSRDRGLGDTSQEYIERTVELSPHEQLLLTPSNKEGESLNAVKPNTSQDVCSPLPIMDDSDNSIFEDTPQKTRRFMTVKKSIQETCILPVINQSDKIINPNYFSSDNLAKQKTDTPTSISRFSDDVKVCSTPVVALARRSLSYKEDLSAISEDHEVASYYSNRSNVIKPLSHTATCVEKEMLEQAFESSVDKCSGRNSTIIESNKQIPRTQLSLHPNAKYDNENKKLAGSDMKKSICVACSCLNKGQIDKVKALVGKMGWKFTNEYEDDLTHLIVKVDDNNHSQRSVKYMQALAAGKWILSLNWIQKCHTTNSLAPEEEFEVLDSSGEMGPHISRTRASKIFEGFTFYCCPPFTVINYEVLCNILKSSGGNIVDTIGEIEVQNPQKVSLLLGEPSSTEDDRFIDMAMNHKIVPLGFEWVTECLGEGNLLNAGYHLLVPRSLLPTVRWPLSLTTEESVELGEAD